MGVILNATKCCCYTGETYLKIGNKIFSAHQYVAYINPTLSLMVIREMWSKQKIFWCEQIINIVYVYCLFLRKIEHAQNLRLLHQSCWQ